MPQPVRVATVGLGWVALHRHLPVMKRSRRFEVVGVIDRAPGRARAVAAERRLAHSAEASSLAGVDWLDQVDAITVATAPMGHAALIGEALALGKHVLTEKPFTMTVPEGEALLAAAAKADRRLAIVHNFQFSRSARKLAADLEGGRLGEVRSVSAVQFGNPRRRLPEWYEQLPLGLFYDESPHLLYLLRRLAGDLRLARCLVSPSTRGLVTPARLDAHFTSPDFAGPITLSCNFESPISEWYLAVFGEKAAGIVDVFRDIYVRLGNDEGHDTLHVLATSLAATRQHWWQHVTNGPPHLLGQLFYGNEEVFDRFGRAIDGEIEALAPICGERALDVLKLQHAIIERQEIIGG
ncbi:MAG TPA: Gfo/Idh/MocA family oxidoreductase [Caulobacteraceae bacterium]|nr:Gfo/Idh/MocA family oxidoreductase [Caulobacteraceae bacterium]